jgi:transposase
MAKTFREWKVDQAWLLPPSVREMVPAGDPAHFVRDLVRDELDLSAILDTYDEERGYPPYHPVMMTALLLYSFTQGIYSSRRIARACVTRIDVMAVTAMQQPDFRTISDFRLRHLEALGALFGQVLKLCQRAKMVKLGHVALDGTKVKANASKHKAMSYEHMKKKEAELKAEVARWFAKAAALDEEEDRLYGPDKQGDELPDWVMNKQKRLEVIRAAKAELEAEAKTQLAAGVKPGAMSPKPDGPDKPPRKRNRKPPKENGEPNDKAQLNFTDVDSRILKGPHGFLQGYNCQAAVDAEAQIIIAHATTNEQNDAPLLVPMVDRIRESVGRNPEELSADSGYSSEENLKALRRRHINGYIATGRVKHGAEKPAKGRPLGPLANAMRIKLARAGPRSRYRLRKQVVEPVFGQMKEGRAFRGMLLRGMRKVPHEWAMMCTAHNLLKLARRAA